MSDLSVNGARAVSGSITIPFYGAWSADIVMAVDAEVASKVTLVVADLSLVGTVVRQAAFAGSRTLRIVGGAGGWKKEIPAKGYGHQAGVKLSTVLSDAAKEVGETIWIDSDRTLGTHYAREQAKSERTLHLLTDGEWWIDLDGTTQTKARNAAAIVNPFNVISWSGARGQFEIASETLVPWQPGRTFSTNTVLTVQTVSSVTIESDNEGKLRLHVLSTDGATERLRTDLRALIRSEIASLSYGFTWGYTVAALDPLGLSTVVDIVPDDDRMPPLTGVPIASPGVVAASLNTKCRVRFVNGDMAQPEVVSVGVTTEHFITTEATVLLIYNTLATLMAAAGGGPLLAVVLQPLLATAITGALAAQSAPAPPGLVPQTIAAATLQAGFATGVAPSPAMFAGWTALIAALATKTPNASGSFPNVGVPNVA